MLVNVTLNQSVIALPVGLPLQPITHWTMSRPRVGAARS